MAKNKLALIDKTMIESFASEIDSTNAYDLVYKFSDLLDDISIDLAGHNKFISINNVDSKLFGDFATRTNYQESDLNMYLLIKSGQLELNTVSELQNKRKMLWRKIKLAWANRRASKKKRKLFSNRKKRKDYDLITEQQLKEKKEKPYTILNLKDEFFEYIVNFMSQMTVVYNYPDKITVLSKEDLGYKINIVPAFVHDDEIRVWNARKNKFKIVYLDDALIALDSKNKEIDSLNYSQNATNKVSRIVSNDNLLLKVIKIYKALTHNIWNTTSLDFIDSLIYNCPNEIFVGNVYDVFVRSINFLKNADISDFRSIYNTNKSLYEDEELSIYEIKSLIKEISNLITNN